MEHKISHEEHFPRTYMCNKLHSYNCGQVSNSTCRQAWSVFAHAVLIKRGGVFLLLTSPHLAQAWGTTSATYVTEFRGFFNCGVKQTFFVVNIPLFQSTTFD